MGYQVKSEETWFTRMAKAVGQVGLGIAMVLGAFPLLIWNENHAAGTEKTSRRTREDGGNGWRRQGRSGQ